MWKSPDAAWAEFKMVPKDQQETWFKAALKTVYNEGQMDPPWLTSERGAWSGDE